MIETHPQSAQAPKAISQLAKFMLQVAQRYGCEFTNFAQLHSWSIAKPAEFWESVWRSAAVAGQQGSVAFKPGADMLTAQFFPEARLNFAENLLRRNDDTDALVFRCEDRLQQRMSWGELNEQVSKLAQALRSAGVSKGDRIAALMPNAPETVVAMLAATSIGAIWSSCSPDFGEAAVLDRFGQIKPKVLFAVDGYFYAGKEIDILPKLESISRQLISVERVIVLPFLRAALEQKPSAGGVANAALYPEFIAAYDADEIDFVQVPFDHPLYILFSSGTTGAPKCIVHSVGGTLIQHLKEHQLHCDIRAGDRVFYFTTCTWMMWNWLVSALASEATLLLYDGSPFYPHPEVLFEFADTEQVTLFGTSAKYLDSLRKDGVRPRDLFALSALRLIASTGSPLAAESFDYVYENIKQDVYLASISGGTDIVSCFVLGNPLTPVHRGEIPGPGLGMAVEIWNEAGEPVHESKGELVCTQPFPSMPVGFWNDKDGKRYHQAYFARFPGVWTHGDFAEQTANGGFIIYGRSDATLNPGGVRIGTAEIYRQVERLDQVMESLAIGQPWEGDVRIVLFVVLRPGLTLDAALEDTIRTTIRSGASPRHVPAKILQVTDIPRTKSGKISELAVREIVTGGEISNEGALANPEALDQFRNLDALRS